MLDFVLIAAESIGSAAATLIKLLKDDVMEITLPESQKQNADYEPSVAHGQMWSPSAFNEQSAPLSNCQAAERLRENILPPDYLKAEKLRNESIQHDPWTDWANSIVSAGALITMLILIMIILQIFSPKTANQPNTSKVKISSVRQDYRPF